MRCSGMFEMIALRDMQAAFRAALLDDAEENAAALIRTDGMDVSARLGIYRDNVRISLTRALAETYPVVCRLVDERFFRYAADSFIRADPPREAALAAYGAGFAGFLAEFPACRELAYLPDVARLEWLLHCAAHASVAPPITPDALSGIAPDTWPALALRLDPSLGLLASDWPVSAIWRANRPGVEEEAVTLERGGERLEIRRIGDDVVFRPLDPGVFAFRAALALGEPLESAAERALTADPALDVTAAFQALFFDRLVVGFTIGDDA